MRAASGRRAAGPVPAALTLAFLALAAGAPADASAQEARHAWVGIRGGVSVDPDQGLVGFHVKTPEIAPGLRIQPSFELGLGGGIVIGYANVDLVYRIRGQSVTPLVGGGPTIALYDDEGSAQLNTGVSILGGLEWGRRRQYLFEVRVGFGNVPALKAIFGYDF